MSKRKNAWNKAKESWKKVLEWWKNIKKWTLNVIWWTAWAVWYTLLSAWEKWIAIASKHRKKKYSDKSKKHISKAWELGIQAIKWTGETLKWWAKIVGYSVKWIHHSVDTVDKAIWEQLEKIWWKRKLKFLRDNIITILVPTLIIWGVAWGTADIIKADKRKNADREKYGAIELKNNEAKTFEESTDNIVYYIDENWEIIDSLSLYNFFDETLKKNWYENDSIISSTGLITTITSENALKSKWKWHKIDKRLEKHWAERSKNSESIIWKFLAYIFGKNWSYWLFQTQREAIENWYKNNPERYNNICKTIANFKLPNNNGEREELCKQLNYKSENEMISDLKEKNLPIYTWGEKLWIALWIVLLNEQWIDRDAWWKRYKNNYANIIENTQKIKEDFLCQAEGPIRQALTREKKEGEALKSIYILTESTEKTWKDRISFRNIQETLKSPEFRAWEIAAWRCTDIQARKNWEYLLDLSIAELNQRFNNEINWNHDNLNITSPTGTFGPTSTKLAIKHLKDYLPEEIKDNANSEEIKNYLDKHPEIIKEFKDKVIADYIINFRRLFLLNGTKEEINEWKSNWNELNEKQMDFLEQNLNLSFNHLYISEQCFHEYVKEKSWSTNELDSLRNDYITNVEDTPIQKEKRKKITKIITHEKEFMNSTWLTKEDYEKFIKHRLWPTLIWTSIILSETWNVVPENQEKRTGTGVCGCAQREFMLEQKMNSQKWKKLQNESLLQ